MTGIVNMFSGIAAPAASTAKSSEELASLSSKLNLGSMALDLFAGGAQAYGIKQEAKQAASALEFQSKDILLQAKQEEIKGQQTSNQIMDAMLQTIAGQRAGFAAAGMDIGFGTPVSLEASTRKLAERKTGVTKGDALMMAVTRRKQSAAILEERANVLSTGEYSATAALAEGGIRAYDTYAEMVRRKVARGE